MSRKPTMDDVLCPACCKPTMEPDGDEAVCCRVCDYSMAPPMTVRQMLDGKRGPRHQAYDFAGWMTVDLPKWTRTVARLLADEGER